MIEIKRFLSANKDTYPLDLQTVDGLRTANRVHMRYYSARRRCVSMSPRRRNTLHWIRCRTSSNPCTSVTRAAATRAQQRGLAVHIDPRLDMADAHYDATKQQLDSKIAFELVNKMVKLVRNQGVSGDSTYDEMRVRERTLLSL